MRQTVENRCSDTQTQSEKKYGKETSNVILEHETRVVQANVYRSVQFEMQNWVSTFCMGNSKTIGIMRGAQNDPP
jgi:hypothetical protein